jgi:hypothetical protein
MTRFRAFVFTTIALAVGSAGAVMFHAVSSVAAASEAVCVADPEVLQDIQKMRDILPVLDTVPTVTGKASGGTGGRYPQSIRASAVTQFLLDSLPLWPVLPGHGIRRMGPV